MWRLIRQSGHADTSSRSAAPATEDATYSSVNPTPERAFEGDFVVPLVSSAQAGVNMPMTEPASDGHTSSVPELEVGALSATRVRVLLLTTSMSHRLLTLLPL
ncbi:hypothetical protein Tco_0855738 [Tanacetum coccineum]